VAIRSIGCELDERPRLGLRDVERTEIRGSSAADLRELQEGAQRTERRRIALDLDGTVQQHRRVLQRRAVASHLGPGLEVELERTRVLDRTGRQSDVFGRRELDLKGVDDRP
jgi:hypothetical protein